MAAAIPSITSSAQRPPQAAGAPPEDMVGPCVFLASHASDFVNGQILYADGGILALHRQAAQVSKAPRNSKDPLRHLLRNAAPPFLEVLGGHQQDGEGLLSYFFTLFVKDFVIVFFDTSLYNSCLWATFHESCPREKIFRHEQGEITQ